MTDQLDLFTSSRHDSTHDGCECGRRKLRQALLCVRCNTRKQNLARRRPAEERFWGKVKKTADGCWEWLGSHNGKGYSTFTERTTRPGQRKVLAHRFAYEAVIGPIPDGLQLDHLCRNKGCVNPQHLEPVTPKENTRRAWPLARERDAFGRFSRSPA